MESPRRNGFRLTIAMTVCGLVLLGAAAFTVRYVVLELPSEIAKRASAHAVETAREIARAFQVQPRVTIAGKTVVEQQTSVLELATLEKRLTERQRLDESWLQSTKTLEIEVDFTIRAGFDLAKPFLVDIDRTGSGLRVTLPPAQILGVDVRDVRFLRDEDGLWNKLTAADREQAIRTLRNRVEREARQSDLAAKARAVAEKRLTEVLASGGQNVTFEPARKP